MCYLKAAKKDLKRALHTLNQQIEHEERTLGKELKWKFNGEGFLAYDFNDTEEWYYISRHKGKKYKLSHECETSEREILVSSNLIDLFQAAYEDAEGEY